MRFAIKPNSANLLKCAMATGAVAKPAMSEDKNTAATGRNTRGIFCVTSERCHAPNTATNAVVAANDIWKPGPSSVSGLRTRTISAANAKARNDITRRSKITAKSATATMTKALSVATFPPESPRYPAPTANAATAASFFTGHKSPQTGTSNKTRRRLAKTNPVKSPM